MLVSLVRSLHPCFANKAMLNASKSQKLNPHYEKTVLTPRFKNAAIGYKNAALGPFGLRPRFITRPKTCDYRPGQSKAALFEPRPKTRSYSRGKNMASDRPGLSTIWPPCFCTISHILKPSYIKKLMYVTLYPSS